MRKVFLGASTSKAAGGDDAFLARMMQEQEMMKQRLETAMKACQKMESLEEEIQTLKKSQEEAVMEAKNWKREALKSGNKRSRIATSPSAHLKLHTLEVEALKELRLQELNRRREMEQENARLKEELSKREAAKKDTPGSSFRERLDDVDKEERTTHKSCKGKKKAGEIDGNTDVERKVFIRGAKKELRGKKKDAITKICLKEGVKYTTFSETIAEIIAKRVDRAFGKRPAIQEVSNDVVGDPLNEDKEDGRDSATS
ncbi:hypothetical protein CBR_g1027 [Chara braunii]|uniref:Uncharacterized protein n=1 Tax=Chara braunii TaxID=69332 RepID=A0A388KCW8_CHABU|nr:hypothetical protein CBR_g1027 [Chara braunii]|eukprot:GBG67908.1 hypothetical protein CBR_g1027 [Chara braunii]